MSPDKFVEYMSAYAPIVKMRGYFPSVFLAQSALESGWGKSPLAKGFNFWGHKWKPELDQGRFGWMAKESDEEIDGKRVPMDSRFRVYPDMDAAVKAYCDKWEECWPNGTRKYNPDLSSPQEFIASVAPRYCNDSEYVTHITGIISRYSLTQFD